MLNAREASCDISVINQKETFIGRIKNCPVDTKRGGSVGSVRTFKQGRNQAAKQTPLYYSMTSSLLITPTRALFPNKFTV